MRSLCHLKLNFLYIYSINLTRSSQTPIEKAKTHFTVQISNTEDARLIKVLCSKIQFLQLHLHQGERISQSSRLSQMCTCKGINPNFSIVQSIAKSIALSKTTEVQLMTNKGVERDPCEI